MRHEISVERPGSEPEHATVEGPVTAGGTPADGLVVAGLAPGALRLVPAAAGLVVEPLVDGARVAGRVVAPGARRLLRVGEAAELQGIAIRLVAPHACGGTRLAAAALLRDAAAGEALAAARIVVLSGSDAGARHPLAGDATLGRGRAATIRIADPGASRIHLRLRVDPAGVTVEDLGSKNGVRLDGVRIEPRRPSPLTTAQELSVGETLLALEAGSAGGVGLARRAPEPGAARPESPPARAALRLVSAALLALAAAALALAAS